MVGVRVSRVMRGVVPAVLVALLLPAAPIAAADPPTTVAGLLGRYYDLSHEAEKVNEELLRVQEDVVVKRQASIKATDEASAANAAAETARAKARTAREDTDRVTALLSGRQTGRGLSTFVTGASPDDVLVKMEAASLAGQVSGRVVEFGGAALAEAERAAQHAVRAQDDARSAEAAVAEGAGKVEAQKLALDGQIAEVRTALDRLTPEQRSLLTTSEFSSADVKIPSGNLRAVIEFVRGQLGKPYLWGGVGPDAFDCSGLMQTAFGKAGIVIPRVSIQQSGFGRQVQRHEVRPGDLIFYYNPVHHVAIAVDNSRAVHAPSFGETVKIAGIDNIGPITVIRRVMQ